MTACERFDELITDLVEKNNESAKIISLSDDELKAFGAHRLECDQCYTLLVAIGFLEYYNLPEDQKKRIIEALYPEGYDC